MLVAFAQPRLSERHLHQVSFFNQAALSNQATFPESINLPAKSFNCWKVRLGSNSG